jgi:DNA-binding NarL/FixJ family response regulator
VPPHLQHHFHQRDAGSTQGSVEVTNDGPAPQSRWPIVAEAALCPAGNAAVRNGCAERLGLFATVLIGCSGLLQEVLVRILDETDFQVTASADSVDQLAFIDARQYEAILLIVDARHDAESAIMQVQLFKQLYPVSRVAVLTETDRMDDLASLYLAGTNVCFSNGATLEIFLKSVELAMLGETLLPSTLLAYVRHREFAPDPEPAFGGSVNLSAQEDRILRNLAEGHSNKIIARRLGIAEATVKVHVKNILCKIGAHNRTQAAVWAMDNASLGRQAEGLEIGNA